MALKALLGSTEFDPLDTKFYYNPDNGLLEPITKEARKFRYELERKLLLLVDR